MTQSVPTTHLSQSEKEPPIVIEDTGASVTPTTADFKHGNTLTKPDTKEMEELNA